MSVKCKENNVYMAKKTKKVTLQKLARSTMRECALRYREWIAPQMFDGTLTTYHRNIGKAIECLQAAKNMRNLSHEN